MDRKLINANWRITSHPRPRRRGREGGEDGGVPRAPSRPRSWGCEASARWSAARGAGVRGLGVLGGTRGDPAALQVPGAAAAEEVACGGQLGTRLLGCGIANSLVSLPLSHFWKMVAFVFPAGVARAIS